MKLNNLRFAFTTPFLLLVLSCVASSDTPENSADHLFKYLDERIGELSTIFLTGEQIDFLVSRE